MFNLFKKKSASVKFYINSVAGDWWSKTTDTGDTSNAGIVSTYETLPDVYLITDYISQIVANIPVKIVNRAGKDTTNKDLANLIYSPNYYQSWKELIKQFTAYYEILGNSYIYTLKPEGMRMVSSLHVLPASVVEIYLSMDKTLPDFMNEIAGYKLTIGGKEYFIPAENVLHKRNTALRYIDGSYIYGVSKYVPGNKVTTELKAIYDAKTSIIANRGALGIISNESEIPNREESEEVKEKLRKNFGLGTDQDKFIVTTQKLSWQQMSMGIAELQIIENAKYSFAKLCQLNGFDPVIFSTEGSTFANKAEAEKAMMKKVIKPKVDDLYEDLNNFLRQWFGGDMIVPDWSRVEELQADTKSLTDILAKQIENSIITPREAYVMLYDKEPENNAIPDEYFRRSSLTPAIQQEPAQPAPGLMAGDTSRLTDEEAAKIQEELNNRLNGN